jgi:hypothetical protein
MLTALLLALRLLESKPRVPGGPNLREHVAEGGCEALERTGLMRDGCTNASASGAATTTNHWRFRPRTIARRTEVILPTAWPHLG